MSNFALKVSICLLESIFFLKIYLQTMGTLGFKVIKLFKILIKTFYVTKYIEMDIQDIDTLRIDDRNM